ncbi:hypothetical protein KP509_38G038000 [Ceratopteris richardii]|nr:hypothetical protein KP509_38G038000 [Ceratopteris richardii]
MFLADLAQEDPTYRILQRTKQVGLSEAEEHVDPQIKDATSVPRMRASSPAFLKDSLKTVICSDSSLVQHHRSRDVCLPPLRRTSTDPAIVKHVGDRFSKSIAVNAPESGRIFPCEEERWAGPAYSSSPPPSSLPFPKLCLPRAKVISHSFTPLVKQHSISVHIPLREPYAPTNPCSMDGGASDVAFATRNLRRLLNLDAR